MAYHYIRAAASGSNDGSSWANAWTTFGVVVWTRGDTYYVAGGTYTELVYPNKAASGSLTLAIKKANAADNSSDPGWDSSYATTQAVIAGELDLDSYVTIDGVTGSGISGHGIKIYRSAQPTGSNRVYGIDATLAHNVSISHLEVLGPGYHDNLGPTDDGLSRGVNFNLVARGYIQYCWIHEWSENGVVFGAAKGTSYSDLGGLVADTWISETGGTTGTAHGQAVMIRNPGDTSDYLVFRNNVFRNTIGTAFLSFLTGTYNNTRIYNNIFYITDLTTYPTISPAPIYGRDPDGVMVNCGIYNNVFWGLGDASHTGVVAQLAFDGTGSSGVVVENNVWENSRFSAASRGLNTVSNNGYYGNNGAAIPSGTTNQVDGAVTTFTNAAGGVFTLTAGGYAVGAGLDLSATFTTDATGVTRSVPWDLGVYKFQSLSSGLSGSATLSGKATL